MNENLTWKVLLVLLLTGLSTLVILFAGGDGKDGDADGRIDEFDERIKLGFDLRGGVELRYKVEGVLSPEKEAELTFTEAQEERKGLASKVTETVDVIRKRLDPDGTLQPDIRAESGGEIVIRLQGLSQGEVDRIKKLVTDMGVLNFRIVVPEKEYEKLDEEERKNVRLMTLVHPATKNQAEQVEQLYIQLQDEYNITGENVSNVQSTMDRMGAPAVAFTLDPVAADKFAKLTKFLADRGTPPHFRRMAILLNNRLQSAPRVKRRITGGGVIIEGIEAELIGDTVAILKAGSLPTRLIYESEIFIGPELGSDSLARGRIAIILSMSIVLIFMVVYYARSGLIADFAMLLNLLFIVSIIMLSNSVLTLPGIAGIVLTVGMSVDANVLIYERIREERAKGKVLRFAIKNGYERAFWTIVDANLTTLITAIVLWVFLTGPVRWFAVTLSIGILSSMFTSLFVTRLVFDLLVRAGLVKELRMMKLVSNPKLKFVKWAPKFLTISVLIIVVGMAAFIWRGKKNLGIEFTSGTAGQLSLTEPMNIQEVRDIVQSLGYDNAQVVTASLDANEIGKTVSKQFVIRVPQRSAEETQKERAQVLDNIEEAFKERVPSLPIVVTLDGTSKITDADDPFKGGRLVTVSFASRREMTPAERPRPETSLVPANPTDAEVPLALEAPKPEDATTELASATAEITPREPEVVFEPVSLKPEVIETALAGTGLGKTELVRSEKRLFYFTAEFKTTETNVKKIKQAMTASGLIVVPHAFAYKQFVGPAQAHRMVIAAIAAILVSMIFIVLYIWIRFGNIRYGLGAITALAHDVFISLGAIAIAGLLAGSFLGNVLQLGEVEIDLKIVAAILTVIGYSLNDTIVVFDRIRENLGHRRELTTELIDRSVNQTLSRTILTSLTTLIVCLTLYIAGGRQLHGLAFCLTVGVMVGTYSSIFIASPLLVLTHGGVADRVDPRKSGGGARD